MPAQKRGEHKARRSRAAGLAPARSLVREEEALRSAWRICKGRHKAHIHWRVLRGEERMVLWPFQGFAYA